MALRLIDKKQIRLQKLKEKHLEKRNENRNEQLRIINELNQNLLNKMVTAFNEGKIPESWSGFEIRHLMSEIVKKNFASISLRGKRKKAFKNHLLTTPGLVWSL